MVDFTHDKILKSWQTADYERRHYRRWQINECGVVKYSSTQVPCLVHDISPGGACVRFDNWEKLALHDKIVLQLKGLAPLVAEVRSARDGQLGLAFLHVIQGQQALAKWLTDEESTKRQHRRNNIVCPATLYVNEHAYHCSVQNVSLGGAKIEGEEITLIQLSTEIALEISEMEAIQGNIRYKIRHSIGIKFNHTDNSLQTLIDWINQKTQDY